MATQSEINKLVSSVREFLIQDHRSLTLEAITPLLDALEPFDRADGLMDDEEED